MMPKYRSRIASCSFSLSFTTGSASVVAAPERRLSLSLSFSRSSMPFRSRSLRSYFSRGSRFSRANRAVTGTSPNFGTLASEAAFMAATSS
uniref:Putative secreted protein n=1 Tax=Anopheles marajoara TaxID=58244 RepID=A0A2M4C9V4_9DIPT